MHPLKIGDVIKSKPDRLDGVVEAIEGESILCRMKRTGTVSTFRREQLDHMAQPFGTPPTPLRQPAR